jgi:peptidyl-tRNA hydrolase
MSSSADNADTSSSSSPAGDVAAETTPTSYAQHIVLRGDLLDTWGTGPMITQGAHVSVAAIETYRHMPQTQTYLQELDSMRKVTWKAKNEAWLEKIAERLDDANVEYKIWVEQPENIKVGLATRPVLREETEAVWKGNGIKMWR